MRDDILKYLSDKLRDERLVLSEDMSMGKAKDFGVYKYACGIIRGLMMATSVLVDTAQKLEDDDD